MKVLVSCSLLKSSDNLFDNGGMISHGIQRKAHGFTCYSYCWRLTFLKSINSNQISIYR